MTLYVALLRGINVGRKNLIKMPELKASFEAEEFDDVVTYIQSGNVLFRATGSGSALTRRIETMLTKTFDHYNAWAVVRTHAQMRSIVEKAPEGFGKDPQVLHKHDHPQLEHDHSPATNDGRGLGQLLASVDSQTRGIHVQDSRVPNRARDVAVHRYEDFLGRSLDVEEANYQPCCGSP